MEESQRQRSRQHVFPITMGEVLKRNVPEVFYIYIVPKKKACSLSSGVKFN